MNTHTLKYECGEEADPTPGAGNAARDARQRHQVYMPKVTTASYGKQ